MATGRLDGPGVRVSTPGVEVIPRAVSTTCQYIGAVCGGPGLSPGWVIPIVLQLVPYSLLVGCFTSQQQVSVSQGRICLDNFTCCHTEIDVADQTCYLTQSQYTDTGPTSPSADPITPGAWQGSHWSANF